MTEKLIWRLINSGYLPGAMNMAIDEALLMSVSAGCSAPILRFYRWEPAALSIGFSQLSNKTIDIDACRSLGVDVVRRPTGGRAVFHQNDVTYAVVAPFTSPFSPSVIACYRVVASILREALNALGLPVELSQSDAYNQANEACFSAPARHELLINGHKIAGCAQKRQGRSFLQHGAIPLDFDWSMYAKVMESFTGNNGEGNLGDGCGLNRYGEGKLTVAAVEQEIVKQFEMHLDISFVADDLSADEIELANVFCRERYVNYHWTKYGGLHS